MDNYLGYRKRCSSWVPLHLTDEHKATRMGSSLDHLLRFQEEGVAFLHRIFTGGGMWINQVTPEMKRATMARKHPLFSPSKMFKTTPSAKNLMAIVFLDQQDVLLVDFLIRGVPLNATSYCSSLDRSRKAIHRKPL